jgi:hypothetical protein
VAASGALGAGVDAAALDGALDIRPHFIASDAGTTDAGPFALGSGKAAFPREAIKRDLARVLIASRKAGIPALIGSAGTAGGDPHVDWVLDIAREIVEENRYRRVKRSGVLSIASFAALFRCPLQQVQFFDAIMRARSNSAFRDRSRRATWGMATCMAANSSFR